MSEGCFVCFVYLKQIEVVQWFKLSSSNNGLVCQKYETHLICHPLKFQASYPYIHIYVMLSCSCSDTGLLTGPSDTLRGLTAGGLLRVVQWTSQSLFKLTDIRMLTTFLLLTPSSLNKPTLMSIVREFVVMLLSAYDIFISPLLLLKS